MKSRRKALQIEIGINQKDFNFAVTNLKRILLSYTGQPDEDLRKILFLKDLSDYCKMHESKKELLIFLSKILVEVPFNFRALKDYKKFYAETKNRQAARKSSF